MTQPNQPRQRTRDRLLRVAALVALSWTVAASRLADAPLDERVRVLREELHTLVSSNAWRFAKYGVLALSLETGDTLFDQGSRELLAPASNMKLLTTAAALRFLGPDFRYRTFLLADGPIEGGRLRGDLILYGTGDPGLSDDAEGGKVLDELAQAVASAGITAIEGRVVGDGTFFDGPLLGEGWNPDDLNDWFTAPSSALTFDENMVTLRIAPSEPGSAPMIHTIPEGADLPMQVTAVTGGGGGRVMIRREDPSQPISIEGSLSSTGREVWRQMTVTDPPRFAASVLANALQARGVTVAGGVGTITSVEQSPVTASALWAPGVNHRPAPRILAAHESRPLVEYLEIVNKKSHNLFADLTLKTVGRIVAGDGSFEGGAKVVHRFLADEVATDTSGIVMRDGSGLSVESRVRAATFVDVLKHMSRTPLWEPYWETLPEAGNPHELRRMYRSPAAGNLRAKTGTIDHVSALSGVVRYANGERILFSIIANDLPSTRGAKLIEDRIGIQLASFERPFEPVPEIRTATADAPTAPKTHKVAAGENLTVIAQRYGVTLNALLAANPRLSPRRLLPGVELEIPTAEPGEDATPPAERVDVQVHVVKSGDSFSTIARAYGVSLNDLIAANPQSDPRRLLVGDRIRVPAEK